MKRAFVILLATTVAASAQVQYAFTNLAGLPGGPGSVDGTAGAARFNYPSGVAVDSAGNVYVADSGNSTIRKITPDGAVTTLAGSAGQSGSADGTGSAARFNNPSSVAVDSISNVYVADSDNHTIRKVTPDGLVTTLAGSAGQQGSEDGNASAARFNFPTGVAVDNAGNLFVADSGNHTIREITPAGAVRTLAGTAGQIGWADGVGTAAQFDRPRRVAVDIAGNLYVSDSGNNRISKGTPVFRFDASTGSVTVSNGLFHVRLTGPFACNVVVESSANLQAWTSVQTNALLSGVLDLSVSLGANQNQFFRARLTP